MAEAKVRSSCSGWGAGTRAGGQEAIGHTGAAGELDRLPSCHDDP